MARYEITIRTVGIPLEEIPRTLEQIKNSFVEGYVTGSTSNDVGVDGIPKGYDFRTTGW